MRQRIYVAFDEAVVNISKKLNVDALKRGETCPSILLRMILAQAVSREL